MQNTALPPLPRPPLGPPLFCWTVPPGLEWWDIAGHEPHPPVSRDLLRALTEAQDGRHA